MIDTTDNSEIEEMPLLDDPSNAGRGSRTRPQSVTSVASQENNLLVIGRNCRFFSSLRVQLRFGCTNRRWLNCRRQLSKAQKRL